MSSISDLNQHDISVAALVAEYSYFTDPNAAFASEPAGTTDAGLQAVDLTGYLPTGSTGFFDAGAVFQGGSLYVSPTVSSDQDLLDEFAFQLTGIPFPGVQVSQFTGFMDSSPAEAVAIISDGSGDGSADTLYLGIRGTDNIVDAGLGGQSFTPDGQATYFMALVPFFEAALAYALDNGISKIVVTGGSLGGSMADLFALLLKPQWETQIDVAVVSFASAGVVPGTIDALGPLLGIAPGELPSPGTGGEFTRPDNHLNFSNSEDIVVFPELVPGYLIAEVLLANIAIADHVILDQVTLDGTDVDFTDNTYGDEHGGQTYIDAIAGLFDSRPDLMDVQILAGTTATIGNGSGNTLSAAGTLVGLGGADQLTGQTGDDTLIGNGGDDTLVGGGGDDWYLGGAGNDTAQLGYALADATGAVDGGQIDLAANGELDRFFEVEQFVFTDQTLTQQELLDHIAAQAPAATEGPDSLTGTDGDDSIEALGGDDTISDLLGDDTLRGGDGNDTFLMGSGFDLFDGGPGTDTVIVDITGVAADAFTVFANLTTGEGGALEFLTGRDTFVSIENYFFTGLPSIALTGTSGANELQADQGNDTLMGLDGDDTLRGGAGDDILDGGAGADVIDGGDGYDIASYESATRSVRVDLQNPAISLNDGAGDTFIGIEEFQTGDGIDQLRGDSGDNIFRTGGVSDRLYGRAGDDMLFGEAGADAFYGGLGADTMTGGDDAGRRDRYIYFNAAESGVGAGNRDVITDFVSGEDRIELRRIDADITQGFRQGFDFIGDVAFDGTAGQLRYEQVGGNTIIQADRDGDGNADFEIELTGIIDLVESDFLI